MSLIISEADWQAAKARMDAWADTLALPHGWVDRTEEHRRYREVEGQRLFWHRDGRAVAPRLGVSRALRAVV